ncbi:MAG: DUF6868 family protein [Pirellulaceae bacterium]
MSNLTNLNLSTVSRVLLRCWVMGAIVLAVAVMATQMYRLPIYRIHARMFSLTEDQLDVTLYCFMGFMKLIVLFFFFIPWLAIKMTPK